MAKRMQPASSAGQPDTAAYQAAHFVLHYVPASPAERDIRLLSVRLDALHEALARDLGLTAGVDEPVHVHLLDAEDEDDQNSRSADDAGVYFVYRADTPIDQLERAVLSRLLTASLGGQAGEPSPLVDGVAGYLRGCARGYDPHRIDAAVAARLKEGERFDLADLLRGPEAVGRRLYVPAIVSFTGWLLASFGAEALHRMLREQQGSRPVAEVVTAVTGRTLAQLNHGWRSALRRRHDAPLGVRGFLRGVFRLVRAHPIQAVTALLLTIPAFAFEVFHPIVYAFIVDEGILHHHTHVIPRMTALLVGMILLQGAGSLSREHLFARLGFRVLSDLRYRTFEHLQRLSLDFYARSSAADVSSRVLGALDEVEEAITETFPVTVARFYTLAAWLGLLFYLEWRIGVLSLIALPVAWLGPRLIGPRVDRASEVHREHEEHVAGAVQENVASQPVVKAYGLHRQALSHLRQQLHALTHSAVRMRSTQGLLETVTELGGSIYFVLAIGMGAWLASDGKTTVGTLVASLDLLVYVVPNIRTLFSGTLPPMQSGAHAMRELQEVLEEEPQVMDRPDAHPLLSPAQAVAFEDVTFSYTGEQVNLDHAALQLSRGQFVGVVGASGSGKSTIVSLLLRFYDPMLGAVTFDGEDLRRLTQESARAQIGAVFQETVLFNTTIRENIRVGRLDATDADVEAAAQAAAIHDFISALPQKYDTPIGGLGHRLSGGQRQRIAIARALVRHPALLVLDEATSALDTETGTAIMTTVRQAAAERIVVAVTHQLTAVQEADAIIVLDRGRIVEQGTHEELLARDGVYARLWGQQGLAAAAGEAETPEAIVERLRSVAMFRSLDPAALTALAGSVATERFEAGEVVYAQGEPADKLYLIVHGRAEVIATDATGAERVAAVLGPGDAFGEMALRRDEPRSATVRSRTASQMLSLERAQILKSAADVLGLPDEERGLVTWLMRHGEATPAQAAPIIGRDEEGARAMLDALVARGYVQEVERGGVLRFRARLGAKRARELPKNIWKALDDRLTA